jgi:cation:H+ antiporter
LYASKHDCQDKELQDSDMTVALIQFSISAIIIIIAGTFLSRFADEIAEVTGFGRLLIGSVLLAGATSLPELTVDISAVRNGMVDLAMGDLMGSSLFNLLILAVLDLSVHSKGKMLSRQAARHALSGNVSAALTALVALGLLAQPVLGGGEVLGISYGIWLILLGYVFGVRLVYCDQRASRAEAPLTEEPGARSAPGAWRRPVLGFVAAAAVIVVTGPFLAAAAGSIADASGLGKTFVGTTLVAFSTSLPELVASLAALRMGAYDLAIGNIFGSNAFNMLLLIPLDLVHKGPFLGAVSKGHALTCVAAITATMIVVLGQLYQVESRKRLIEPDAFLVLVVVFGSLWLIYLMGG